MLERDEKRPSLSANSSAARLRSIPTRCYGGAPRCEGTSVVVTRDMPQQQPKGLDKHG